MKRECPPCRQGFVEDEQVETDVLDAWQSVEGQLGPDARGLDLRCQCFGEGESMSLAGENAYLPASWSQKELAARAAHLALHRKAPPWTDDRGGPCDARVHEAVHAEARAHALELEARRALGVPVQRYPFEARYFDTPAANRHAFLTEYFLAYPRGDGVVPGFVAQYEALCAREAAKVAP